MLTVERSRYKSHEKREVEFHGLIILLPMANALTMLRILLVLPTVGAILIQRYDVALGLVVLGALSDALDGRLARWEGETSDLGKFLDPLADKLFILSAFVALVDTGMVSSLPVILLLLRELSVSFMRSIAAVQGNVFGASFLGKVKTSAEFLALGLLLAGYPLGIHVLWLSVVLAYISAYEYLRAYLREMSGVV